MLLDIREKVRSFGKLERGWDGYGAGPITEKVIKRALLPTPSGTIQFEWGWGLEVEVSEDKGTTGYLEDE
jgi:hypothetical protein